MPQPAASRCDAFKPSGDGAGVIVAATFAKPGLSRNWYHVAGHQPTRWRHSHQLAAFRGFAAAFSQRPLDRFDRVGRNRAASLNRRRPDGLFAVWPSPNFAIDAGTLAGLPAEAINGQYPLSP
jgi:hypothetical protein